MPFYTYSGSWQKIKKAWVYANSAWQPVKKGWVWANSQWRLFFSGEDVPSIEQQVNIAQSTDSASGLVTLTGYNFHWQNYQTLTYYFEWSTDGGSTWSTINTGAIANPSAGSFNTVTYEVKIADTSPNIDNLYRFRVFAQNVTLTNSSTSSSTTISTPRNITISYYSKTYNSITVEFDTQAYAGSYKIRIGSNLYESVLGTTVGGKTRVTASNLSSSTLYSIRVTPYTGGLGSTLGVAFNKGYPGNESNFITAITDDPPVPIQTNAPSAPAGNGLAFTPMAAGSSGTYNNISGSPVTKLIKLISTSTPTNGSTTAQGTVLADLYEVTQIDATTPVQKFYTRDAVTSLNGTVYYYYSTAVTAYVGTVTDNFNRTVPSGLGTSSSGYIYSSYSNLASSWSTNGSVANNSTTVSFGAAATNHPLQTIEINNPNRTYSVSIPTGLSGGIGVAYWVTSSGSWWATVPFYSSATSTAYSCNTPVTSYSCYTPVTSYSCNTPQQTTVYSCGGSASGSFCPDNFTTEYNSFTVGRRCSSCSSTTTYSYTCGTDQYVSNDPGTVVACNSPSHNGQPCYKFFVGEFGIQWIVRYCSVASSTSYSYSVVSSSTATTCTGGPISTNSSGSGCGGCPVSTSTTCTGGPISTNSSGSGCGGCGVSSSTSCTGSAISTDSSGTGCGGCSVSSSTTTSYYTFLNIVRDGSVIQTKNINTNVFSGFYSSSGYSRIYSHSTIVNNNTITARGFNSSGVQIGTDLVYTASNPTKTGVLGDTSGGVIKGHSADLVGNSYEDLSIQ